MWLKNLEVTDFRNYEQLGLVLPQGLTVVEGANGQGKTNLIEAIGYLASLSSFRGSPTEALVRSGASSAVVRAEAEREGRTLLLEAEITPGGRSRTQVNRQPLRRARDLLERSASRCSRQTTWSLSRAGQGSDGASSTTHWLPSNPRTTRSEATWTESSVNGTPCSSRQVGG